VRFARLVAVAWQVEPDAPLDQLMQRLHETAVRSGDGMWVVQPEAFVKGLEG